MVQNFINRLANRNPEQEDVYIQPLQMDINGQYDPEASAQLGLQIQQNTTPLTIQDRLLGREMTQDYQSIDPSTNQAVMSTVTNYKPGALNDLASGFRENYTQGFAPENLAGGKKGLATRIGEGLGTVARFYDKPIGRFATAVALSNLTGETNPWQQGVEAYIGRQNNITNDAAYRQGMRDLGYDEEVINSIPYNMTGEAYKNLATAKYQQGMREDRKLARDIQQEQNEATNLWRSMQLDAQAKERAEQRADRAAQRALTARGQDLTYALGKERLEADKANKGSSQSAKEKDAMSTLNQVSLIRDLVNQNPSATGLVKGNLTGDLLNRLDNNPNNIQTRTAIDALRTKIRHDLTGAQFSPKEAREYEKFLPNVRDNAAIINAKLDALEKRYYADFGVSLTGANESNNNPLNLNL